MVYKYMIYVNLGSCRMPPPGLSILNAVFLSCSVVQLTRSGIGYLFLHISNSGDDTKIFLERKFYGPRTLSSLIPPTNGPVLVYDAHSIYHIEFF